MVFNWFRRQFSTNEAQETPSQDPQVVQPEVAQEQEGKPEETSEPSPDSSQEVAADYLNWAKAAYKNIQQRQQVQPEEAATTESESPSESVTLVAAKPSETATLVAEEEKQEATFAAPETATMPAAVDEPEIAAEIEVVEPQSADIPPVLESLPSTAVELPPTADSAATPEPTEVSATGDSVEAPAIASEDTGVDPLPVWARDNRQERLERLKATAIETPEPVQPSAEQTATITTDTELVSDVTFDEGFLWSAEVLASQGRRPEDVSIEEINWLKQLRQGLDKTRRGLINQLKALVGQGPLNQDAVMQIEALLLQADVGIEATDYIISTLQKRLRQEALPPEQAIAYLKQILRDMLDRPCKESYNPIFAPEKDILNIWLITGVNGAGKTTTIGKIAHLAQKSGYRCLIGAADTFRAAAVEQVKIWGQRSGTEVVANPGKNTDPAAVVFDAIAAAQARETELLLVDTAGRLQNKKNLMDELSKIRRIVDKKAPDAKIESLLVLDSTLGQNGLRQAQVFSEAAKLSGVVLTKLDGTAKGGVALAVVQELGLPIRFIGAGEGIEDLRPFSSYEFVEALLDG